MKVITSIIHVWTGANSHEFGLWNINTLYDKETKLLVVEMPSIKKVKGN